MQTLQPNKRRKLIFAILVFVICEINPLVAKRSHQVVLFLKAEKSECTLKGLKFCGFYLNAFNLFYIIS